MGVFLEEYWLLIILEKYPWRISSGLELSCRFEISYCLFMYVAKYSILLYSDYCNVFGRSAIGGRNTVLSISAQSLYCAQVADMESFADRYLR